MASWTHAEQRKQLRQFVSSSSNTSLRVSESMARADEFDASALDFDPGSRFPINHYHPHDRPQARTAFHQHGPVQSNGPFPMTIFGPRSRSFMAKYYDVYPQWLEYSFKTDAVYCLPCFLFSNGDNDVYVVGGYRNWKKMCETNRDFRLHNNSKQHRDACNFVMYLSHPEQQIHRAINRYTDKQIQVNRVRLQGSVATIRYLVKQGMALRSHSESVESSNRGNFLELLKLLCDRDTALAAVAFDNAPQNYSMTSPEYQKDIIQAFADLVRGMLEKERGQSPFTIFADKALDASMKEQMGIGYRFVREDTGDVREHFLDLVHVRDTCSETLKKHIFESASNNNLEMNRCRGQAYDGASNMRGRVNGLHVLISAEYPFAYYMHCCAHRLQLALVGVVKEVIHVSQFFSTIASICNVAIGSAKRNDLLLEAEAERVWTAILSDDISTGRGQNQTRSISRHGDTRWGSHNRTLTNLLPMFGSVMRVIEDVSTSRSTTDMRAEASTILTIAMSFKFIFQLHLLQKIMSVTDKLSQVLQKPDVDIVNAIDLVRVMKLSLQVMQADGWEPLLHDVEDFCRRGFAVGDNTVTVDVPIMSDRHIARGRPRRNAIEQTHERLFKNDIFYVVIDQQVHELTHRFSDSNVEMLRLAACMSPANNFAAFDVSKLLALASRYWPEDFCEQELAVLSIELSLFVMDARLHPLLSEVNTIAELCQAMASTRKKDIYVLVYRLLRLIVTLPVSTATSERFFLAMKVVKTRLRCSMGDAYLTNALLLYVEKDIADSISDDQIMEQFQLLSTRRGEI